jgi:hypothetical protein
MAALQQFVILVDQLPGPSVLDDLCQHHPDIVVTFHENEGYAEVAFDRDAPTLLDAVISGVRDLDRFGLSATRVRDDDDFVTLADIADRVGRSREAVRLWSVGRTGPGGFPLPVNVNASTSYYRWSQVAPWLRSRMELDVPDPEPVLAAINLALQLRAIAPRVSRMDAVRARIAA